MRPGRRLIGRTLCGLLASSIETACDAEDRATAFNRLARIGFALAAYQADHGGYPGTLQQLAPDDLAALPEDPFTGLPFVYKPYGEGFLIYSLGPNGKDNGGKNRDLDEDDAVYGESISLGRLPAADSSEIRLKIQGE